MRPNATNSRTEAEAEVEACDLPCVRSLKALAELIEAREDLYLRWSAGPEPDGNERSRDELTGVELPGLSASDLSVAPWWEGRPLTVWAARRLYDYEHLRHRRAGTRAWVLMGEMCGRGPDNEPLLRDVRPVAWIAPQVVDQANRVIDEMNGEWGSLDRVAV